MITRIKSQKGSALLLITGILAVMGVVAIFLYYRAEVEWAAVKNLENFDKLQQLAEEQLQERLALFVSDETSSDGRDDAWYGENGEVAFDKDGYQIRIRIEDEGSKPNLNLMDGNGLKVLLDNQSPDVILDWIDPDDMERENGAESTYYQGLNPGYKARNGFFASLEEIKEVKNGDLLYPVLAPEVTVWGKFNLNLLKRDGFRNLLKSIGLPNAVDPEILAENLEAYHANNRFDNLDALLKVNGITVSTRDLLKPYIQFNGSCNPNFVSLSGLKAILKAAGLDTAKAETIINQRDREPYQNIGQLKGMIAFPQEIKNRTVEDYFTVTTTIVNYRIWVEKKSTRYYLDTVYERVPKGIQKGWNVHLLSWRVLLNKDVPDYPENQANSNELPLSEKGKPVPRTSGGK